MSYRKEWHTEESLKSRVRELRQMIEMLGQREFELTSLFNMVQGTRNAIDDAGKMIVLGTKPEETAYRKSLPKKPMLPSYREQLAQRKGKGWQTEWLR